MGWVMCLHLTWVRVVGGAAKIRMWISSRDVCLRRHSTPPLWDQWKGTTVLCRPHQTLTTVLTAGYE